jgi:hypothetical protein
MVMKVTGWADVEGRGRDMQGLTLERVDVWAGKELMYVWAGKKGRGRDISELEAASNHG